MPRTGNKFVDPAGVRPDYVWPVNHSQEDEAGKVRNIEHGANTGQTGLVRQQSDDSESSFKFQGVIFHKAQLEEMWEWFNLSKTQTIYFIDFAVESYEVLFTEFRPTRQRTLRNPRDFANAPLWYWRYSGAFEIIRTIDGTLFGG